MAASASIICNYQWDGKGKVMPSSEKIRDIRSQELEVVNKVPQHFNPNLIAKLKYSPIV